MNFVGTSVACPFLLLLYGGTDLAVFFYIKIVLNNVIYQCPFPIQSSVPSFSFASCDVSGFPWCRNSILTDTPSAAGTSLDCDPVWCSFFPTSSHDTKLEFVTWIHMSTAIDLSWHFEILKSHWDTKVFLGFRFFSYEVRNPKNTLVSNNGRNCNHK